MGCVLKAAVTHINAEAEGNPSRFVFLFHEPAIEGERNGIHMRGELDCVLGTPKRIAYSCYINISSFIFLRVASFFSVCGGAEPWGNCFQ